MKDCIRRLPTVIRGLQGGGRALRRRDSRLAVRTAGIFPTVMSADGVVDVESRMPVARAIISRSGADSSMAVK